MYCHKNSKNFNKDLAVKNLRKIGLCTIKNFLKKRKINLIKSQILKNLNKPDKLLVAKNIKKSLNLINYPTIHLRIEDDAINYFPKCYNLTINQYNKKLLLYYDNNIKKIKQNTYICSGILHYDNKINYNYYKNLIKNNNLLLDKSNIPIDKYYLNNRELIAIVDLLIAYDSDQFIGCYVSSFSSCIYNYFKCNNKNNIDLFNL